MRPTSDGFTEQENYGEYLIRVIESDLFDVHAAHGADDHDRTIEGAVQEDREVSAHSSEVATTLTVAIELVQFTIKRDAFMNEDFGDRLSFGPGLVSDEVVPQHSLRVLHHLVRPVVTSVDNDDDDGRDTHVRQILTPPLKPVLKCPLPRPPARICAFTTSSGAPSSEAIAVLLIVSWI